MTTLAGNNSYQTLAPIVNIETVAPRHFLMSLNAPDIAHRAQAGQFVHILSRDTAQFDPLLRRAFSILATRPQLSGHSASASNLIGERPGQGEIDILFRVEGVATAQLASKQRGDFVDVIGPLGQPFDLSVFHVKHTQVVQKKRVILVGGGVGVPPLIFLGAALRRDGLEPLMLIGARRANEVIGLRHFQELRIEARIATDDGSMGVLGRVTQLLEAELQNEAQTVVYACGPLAMLRAVAEMSDRYGALCQVSLEENMPCGIGVCNGCVVPMKEEVKSQGETMGKEMEIGGTDYERYKRICVAGPAVWSHFVDWEAL